MQSILDRFGIFYGWWIVFCAATIVFLSAGVFFTASACSSPR